MLPSGGTQGSRAAATWVAPQAPVIQPDDSGIGTLPLDLLLLAVGAHAQPKAARGGIGQSHRMR